jgi:hypothetical protein
VFIAVVENTDEEVDDDEEDHNGIRNEEELTHDAEMDTG